MRFILRFLFVAIVLSVGIGARAADFTPAYPAQPPQGMVYWGAAIAGNGDPARHEQPTGTALPIHRTYYQWSQRNTSFRTMVSNDLAANRLPWISLKTPKWSEMASGLHDSEIDEVINFLRVQTKPVWLTIWHEPENDPDQGTAADHLGMNRRVRQRMTALGSTNIALVECLMSWTWDTRSGRNAEDWWASGIYDVLGIDHYSNSDATLLTPVWTKVRQFGQAKGVDVAVGEWGIHGTDAAAGQFVRDWYNSAANSYADGQGARITGIAAFDSSLNSSTGSWELTGEQLAAFQQLMSDPRTARIGPLSAPSALSGTVVSTSRIDLSWAESSLNESGFKIERKTGQSGAWAVIGTVGANVKTYQNSGLATATNYVYRVRSFNAAGYSSYTSEVSATTQGTVNQAPTVQTQASATPSPVTGTTTVLSVFGADDQGEPSLTYAWATTGTPPAGVSFSANGNNGAKQTTATFSKPGSYSFTVTIKDAAGLTATSSVNVTVNATVASISVSPSSATVQSGQTQQFTASATDQFGGATTPAIAWTVGGGGTISSSGLFTAGATAGGPFTVTASAGGKSGTAAVSVVVPAPVGNGDGLLGAYFDDQALTVAKLSRVDSTVNFDWGTGSPDASIEADTFSVRWTGQVQAQFSETYTFYTTSDDGVRLWVNNQLLVDNWTDHGPTENSGTITLAATQKYDIVMEYYENGGGALAKLAWSSPSTPKQIVPQSQLYSIPLVPADAPGPVANGLDYWYFQGTWSALPDFSKEAIVKKGTVANFDLGQRLQDDNFGFRFQGYLNVPYDGVYTFFTQSDDGSKFFVGTTAVVLNDGLHPAQEASGTIGLKAGLHAIKVAYFEATGDQSLVVSWQGPGISKQTIPSGNLYRKTYAQASALALMAEPTLIPNSAPLISSPATANPNPGVVGQTVTFAVGASDADGDVLSYGWDFGDGTTGDGAGVSHVFATTGIFNVAVMVSDGTSLTTQQLTYVVSADAAPEGTDNGGDANWNVKTSNVFRVTKATIKFNFVSNKDALQLAGTVPVAKFFKPAGKSVTVLLGEFRKDFTLNAKGLGVAGTAKFQMKGQMKNGVFKVTPATFALTVKAEPLFAGLQSLGFKNSTTAKSGLPIDLPVVILVDTMGYEANGSVLYKSVAGKSGSGKLSAK